MTSGTRKQVCSLSLLVFVLSIILTSCSPPPEAESALQSGGGLIGFDYTPSYKIVASEKATKLNISALMTYEEAWCVKVDISDSSGTVQYPGARFFLARQGKQWDSIYVSVDNRDQFQRAGCSLQ